MNSILVFVHGLRHAARQAAPDGLDVPRLMGGGSFQCLSGVEQLRCRRSAGSDTSLLKTGRGSEEMSQDLQLR